MRGASMCGTHLRCLVLQPERGCACKASRSNFAMRGRREAFKKTPSGVLRLVFDTAALRLGGSVKMHPDRASLVGAVHVAGNWIGIWRTRTPVAWNTALAMAGAMAMIGVSPAPAEARSGRSIRWTSSSGTSANRGT